MYYNTRMVFTGLRRAGGVALAIAGLAVLLWGVWPARQESRTIPYAYGEEALLPAGWESLQPPPALARGKFILDWPASIRRGDAGKIRLSLIEEGAQSPCPQAAKGPAFTLISRLELPGIPVQPGNKLAQPIIPCRPVFQAWVVRPGETGNASGTIWLYLGATGQPDELEQELALAAVPLDISLTGLLGLSGPQARLVGVLAILIGLALNIDLLVRRA